MYFSDDWQNTTICPKKQNLDFRNGVTCRGCASQKCYNHIYRKHFDFFPDHAGKIPSISPFYQSKRPFRENIFAIFVPIFGRPPHCSRIPIKQLIDLNISKFYICNVPRILPSEKYLTKKSSFKNAILPVKRPFDIWGA